MPRSKPWGSQAHSFRLGLLRPASERPSTGLWLAGNEGVDKKMEVPIMGLCRDYCKDGFLHS